MVEVHIFLLVETFITSTSFIFQVQCFFFASSAITIFPFSFFAWVYSKWQVLIHSQSLPFFPASNLLILSLPSSSLSSLCLLLLLHPGLSALLLLSNAFLVLFSIFFSVSFFSHLLPCGYLFILLQFLSFHFHPSTMSLPLQLHLIPLFVHLPLNFFYSSLFPCKLILHLTFIRFLHLLCRL